MASWSERVRARAFVLSGDAAQTVALQRPFCEVASEWADLDCAIGAPISSGITAQGGSRRDFRRVGSGSWGGKTSLHSPGRPP